jgi:UDP-N-acetylmuramoylalanine--D-glutamate ligase
MSVTMARRELSLRDPDLGGLRVLVVGLGNSGLAAARLVRDRGGDVRVTDAKAEPEIADAVRAARDLGADVRVGGHPPELAEAADLVVVSPGVPVGIDLLRRARELELPVWGEIELAARFCRGRVIGITGSNGKSTVTSMVGTILRGAGIEGGTGGNLATPFCELLEQDSPQACHSIELSSFQLETVESLKADVAIVLNLSPDHLDRYDSFEAYGRAKARLFELQEPGAHAVLNADDPSGERFRDAIRGRLNLFATRDEVERGAFLREGRLILRTEHGDDDLMSAAELPVPGLHNTANALAAALACRLVGCSAESIVEGLRAYRALPHRLERVGEIRGVVFYNDSKATNPASTACALESFEPGRVWLILGGRDKDADWSPLVPLVRRYARQLLLVGEAAVDLEVKFAGAAPIEHCGSVTRAAVCALESAGAGDVVLLSPGCASFDQYRNFEDRGEDFRIAVGALATREGSDG